MQSLPFSVLLETPHSLNETQSHLKCCLESWKYFLNVDWTLVIFIRFKKKLRMVNFNFYDFQRFLLLFFIIQIIFTRPFFELENLVHKMKQTWICNPFLLMDIISIKLTTMVIIGIKLIWQNHCVTKKLDQNILKKK